MAQDNKEKAPESGKNYLTGLSNKTLDAMYASAARGCGNGEPSKEMKDIETEMNKRYEEFGKGSSEQKSK